MEVCCLSCTCSSIGKLLNHFLFESYKDVSTSGEGLQLSATQAKDKFHAIVAQHATPWAQVEQKKWKAIANALRLPRLPTSASNSVKVRRSQGRAEQSGNTESRTARSLSAPRTVAAPSSRFG